MAALELTVADWSNFLADSSLDIEIEDLVIEDPMGQEFDDLSEDFSAYLSGDSTLKLHDGTVVDHAVDHGEPLCLKKFFASWRAKFSENEEERSQKPCLYIVCEDEATLKKIESILTSLKGNFNVNIEIEKRGLR